jgi:hypothetical protein
MSSNVNIKPGTRAVIKELKPFIVEDPKRKSYEFITALLQVNSYGKVAKSKELRVYVPDIHQFCRPSANSSPKASPKQSKQKQQEQPKTNKDGPTSESAIP